jgi:mono/diheme cytochrome c family protein
MHAMKKSWPVLGLLLLSALLLSGCSLSLAEDVTPPPNYRPPAAQPAGASTPQPVSLETVFPILPPDPAQGAAIYAERCLPCHGASGMGDGPQAASLPNPAPPIGSDELARTRAPEDWYRIVTVGNLERFMPGFTRVLDDRQRWDVVAYVYTLSQDGDVLEEGRALFQASCAECHGPTGRGDGPRAGALSNRPVSWTEDQSRLAALSAEDIAALVLAGKGEMPAFADSLRADQAAALAVYTRTLSFAGAGPAPAQAGAQANPPAEAATQAPDLTPAVPAAAGADTLPAAITITGQVINGTPGGKIPADLQVELAAFADMSPAFEKQVGVEPDGSYRFEEVELRSNYVFFVRVTSGGLTFNSDILHARDVTEETANLPVEIYDTTSDSSELVTDRLHVFFDFSQPGQVQVVNLYIISNPSGRVVAPAAAGQPVVMFDLPQGATNLQFQDGQLGERYVQTENGFGDTAAVMPGMNGMNQILFAYNLPYSGALDLSMKVPMPVAAATVMLPTSGVRLVSEQLIDAGPRDVQGMTFHTYQASAGLQAGDAIAVTLNGNPGSAPANPEQAQEGQRALLIGVGAFGLALLAAGGFLYYQRSRGTMAVEGAQAALSQEEPAQYENSDAILDAIVALDDQNASGGLPEAAYQQRRAELKARLAEMMAREKGR